MLALLAEHAASRIKWCRSRGAQEHERARGIVPRATIDAERRTSLLPVHVGPPGGMGLGGYEPTTCQLDSAQTPVLFTDGLVGHRGEDRDDSLDRPARAHRADRR